MKHQTVRMYHDFLDNRVVLVGGHGGTRVYSHITESSAKRLHELQKKHCTFHGFADKLGKAHENEEFYIYRS